MILIARQIIACSMLLLTSVSLSVQASVVMTGTRIIYPEGSREKVLQLSNKDDHPNLVQLWMMMEIINLHPRKVMFLSH